MYFIERVKEVNVGMWGKTVSMQEKVNLVFFLKYLLVTQIAQTENSAHLKVSGFQLGGF